eukprot:4958790-Prymnesium_polylepis.1
MAGFERGLLRAAGVDANADSLDLHRKLGGHRPTVLEALTVLATGVATLRLSSNCIDSKGAAKLAGGLRVNE